MKPGVRVVLVVVGVLVGLWLVVDGLGRVGG